MLVFKEGVLITAAADKNDDAKITHKGLSDIIDKFIEKYGDQIETWSGDVRVFRDFSKIIDDTLKCGKIAEVQLKIPILKIYKKDFLKSQEKLSKKGLILSEEDLRAVKDEKPEWTVNKRLPKQVLTQGFIDQKQYDIAHLADGFHTIEEIAEEAGIPESEVQTIIDKMDNLGLLQFIEIR
ncbi:MAG TPA: hypothetical protein VGB37_06585 [Candidatus Lokiarchaeia archaeon]